MDPAWILLILFLAMLIGGTIGFGDALIFIPLAALLINIQTAIIISGFWGILMSAVNYWKYRHDADPEYIKVGTITGVPGVIIGALLILYTPVEWIRLFLGIFVLLGVIIQLWKKYGKEAVKPLPAPVIWVGCFSYGFFGGLIGASGPINVLLLQRTDHSKEKMIANFSALSVLLTIPKIIVYSVSGLFPMDLLLIFLLGFPFILAGTLIGHKLTEKIPKEKFEYVVLGFLVIIALQLIITALLSL